MSQSPGQQTGHPVEETLNLSVVVPARNAADMIDACLASIQRNRPREIIIVDGLSRDDTVAIAGRYTDRIISDDGKGVAQARQIGAQAARCPYVFFADVDVELPDGALADLLDEIQRTGADAVQADLRSRDSGDYWSRALTAHHNRGRSRNWFGLSATIFAVEAVKKHPFDSSFRSGEDIEIRHRLRAAGARVGVSERVVVQHRFGPGFRFARDQWLADGAGLGRMVRKYGWRMGALLLVPGGGAVLGLVRSLRRDVAHIPYYLLYLAFNYVGIMSGLLDSRVRPFYRQP